MLLAALFEAPESGGPKLQAGLESLANAMLDDAASRGAGFLKEKLVDGWPLSQIDCDDLGGSSLQNVSKSLLKYLPASAKAFLRYAQAKHLRLAFTPNGRRGNTVARGWYRSSNGAQPEIILVIPPDAFQSVLDLLEHDRLTSSALRSLLQPYTNVLVHELRHAYDDWASDGRYQDNATSEAARSAAISNDDDAHQRYMADPVEISARFTQALSQIESKRREQTWSDYRRAFQWTFKGWRELSPEAQRRLLKRLATHWQEDRPAQVDLPAAVQRLQARLDAAGAKLYLRLTGNAISIEGINYKQTDAIQALLKPILVFADHYGLTVALGDKLPIPAVRPLGFQNQRPRSVNGGLRDYSLPSGTVYLRRPADRRSLLQSDAR